MKRKVFTVIAVFILISTVINGIPAFAVNSTDGNYSKIHFYFGNKEHFTIDSQTELNDATEDLLSIATTNKSRSGGQTADTTEVQVTVEFESNIRQTDEYIAFMQERNALKTLDEIHAFRERLNSYSKEYHSALVQQNMDLLDTLEYSDAAAIAYSPFVVLATDVTDIDADSLFELSNCISIESISIGEEPETVEDSTWDVTLGGINAYDVCTNGTYTGDGVRVGVLEVGGVCNPIEDCFDGIDINYQYTYSSVSDHATAVTATITAMAPDATYYVTTTYEMHTHPDDLARVDHFTWFLDQGCDIINCSFGDYGNTDSNGDGIYEYGDKSYRNDYDGIYDYLIETHLITVVVAAGNYESSNRESDYNPYNEVVSPAHAYNAITVGGVNVTNTNSEYHYTHMSLASYACDSPAVKPNISASFTVFIPGLGRHGGTSFSAPLVTGSIALLFEKDPSYCMNPDKTMSLLTATARPTDDYNATIEGFDEKVGAGVLNVQRLLDKSDYCIEYVNESPYNASGLISKPMYIPAGTEVQIALSWLAVTSGGSETATSVTDVEVHDYDLHLTTSAGGMPVASSILSDSNVEFIRFTIPTSQTYWIEVDLARSISGTVSDYIFLTWAIN